jgi:transcriptional regulator with XRE-family HTH domain
LLPIERLNKYFYTLDNQKLLIFSRKRSRFLCKDEVARFIAGAIDSKKLKQKEIAAICGFKNPNMVTMLKQGTTKVPIEKIPKLASALNANLAEFFELVMKTYKPAEYEVILEVFGEPISAAERMIIMDLRAVVTSDMLTADPSFYINKIRAALISL